MLEHWIWFAELKLPYRLKALLLEQCGSPEALYEEDPMFLPSLDGLDLEKRKLLREKDLSAAGQILSDCDKMGIWALPLSDDAYPFRLKNIPDPPFVLYGKGELPRMDERAVISIVGTRKPSAYGLDASRRLGYQIGCCGGIVVSGMALGVDASAMEGALLSGTEVIGVLGCGPDVVYPRRNQQIYNSVCTQGCILSEYPPKTQPTTWSFPQRNRIIAGLSCGVVLVESPEHSGSLITAERARDQGRDIFAVPGNIDMPGFVGSNRILREGAVPVACGWDVLGEYESVYPDTVICKPQTQPPAPAPVEKTAAISKIKEGTRTAASKKMIDKSEPSPYIDPANSLPKLSDQEQAVVDILRSGSCLVEELVVKSGIPAGKLMGTLTMLEIKKVMKRLPGKRVALNTDTMG